MADANNGTGSETITTSVQFPKAEYQEIKAFVAKNGMKVSPVIRIAVREYMERVNGKLEA